MQYAMPAIVAMTASSLYNIVDSIFIGHIVGPMALSGLAVAKPFMDICAAFGTLVGVGASSIVAITLGRKDYVTANRVLGNVIVLNIIIGGLVLIFGLTWLDPILRSFGASDNTLPYAHDYMFVILSGNILTHIYFGLNNMLRSSGHPNASMIATIVAVVVNIGLDPLFIITFDMGVRGAALATVISQCIAVIWQFTIFCKKDEILHFQKGIWRLDKNITLQSFSIGLSPFLMNMAHCLVFIIINNQLMHYGGDLALGAFGVVNRLIFVFAMIVMGFNQGMQPIVGYNYGAKLYRRMLRAFRLTAIAATIVTTFVTLLGEIFPTLMVKIFTNDAELIAMSSSALRIIVAVFFCVGFQMVTSNFFTSIGLAGKAIFLSLTRQVLYLLPLAYLLPLSLGLNGAWWSLPISDGLAAITAGIMLYVQVRQFKKQIATA